MDDNPTKLHPVDPADLTRDLAFALRFKGRKRVHHADETMARITAERLVEYLNQAGYVVVRRPPREAPTTSGMPMPGDG